MGSARTFSAFMRLTKFRVKEWKNQEEKKVPDGQQISAVITAVMQTSWNRKEKSSPALLAVWW